MYMDDDIQIAQPNSVHKDAVQTSIYVYFENPPGTQLQSTQFTPGQPLHISVQPRVLGVIDQFTRVTVDIHATSGSFPPILLDHATNINGNVAWDIVLPNTIAKAVCIVTVYDFIVGPTSISINIGIGTAPDAQPGPPPSFTQQLTNIIKWVAIGAGVVAVGYLVFKALPTVSTGIKSFQRGTK